MDDKTVLIGTLAVGAIVVVLLMKGGSGGGLSTIAPLPSGDSSGERGQAFSSLLDLGRTELEVRRDLSLGYVQAGVENNRIAAAERASVAESQAQLRMAQMQSSSQSSGSFFDFLGQLAALLPAVL